MSTEIFRTPMAESLSCEILEEKENVMHEPILDDNHGMNEWQDKGVISIYLCDTTPVLTPKYAGKDLNLNSELVKAGFPAISIKHQPKNMRLSTGI
jgi:hypothetical protein